MAENSLHEIVRKAELDLLSGTVRLGEHVERSLHATVEKIFAYLHSTHVSGSTDSLGRKKPFFCIVTAAVNIYYRATDLDRKDITVLPNSIDTIVPAFFATALLQDWMKRQHVGVFLNEWGRTLAQYGSAVCKFVEKDGDLIPSVVPWSRLIVDSIDFKALPRIEKFYKTTAQLKNMATKGHPDYAGYYLDSVEGLIERKSQKTRKNLQGEQRDNRSDFIEIYEVHGELSQTVYKKGKGEKYDDKDDEVFFQQMHVLCFDAGNDGKYENFTLYCGKEKKDPYMLTHLIEEDGQTLSIGAVESLFDAQWMQNHTMKAWKDQMDLASKLVFQTADKNLFGKNVFSNFETGDVIYHDDNRPVEMFPNSGHDTNSIQAFSNQWKMLEREVTSTPDSVRGVTPPSSVPLGTTQIVTNQGLSLFEIMTENKALALEEMMREFFIPSLKKKMNTKEEIMAIMDEHNIKKLDAMYIPKEAIRNFNKRIVKEVLNNLPNGIPSPYQKDVEENAVQQGLAELGNMRPLSPGDVDWNEALKDLEWKLDINISNEAKDKQAILATLQSTLQTIASFAGRPMSPDERLVFNKIMTNTGTVSPLELSTVSAQAPIPSPIQTPQLSNPALVGAGIK